MELQETERFSSDVVLYEHFVSLCGPLGNLLAFGF
jgi:hypothetical protein